VTRRVLVSFNGAGSGVEELSWGQQSVWQTTVAYGSSRTVAGIDALPPGTTVADAAETLRFAVSRHQSLRTRLRFDGGPVPKQVCSASGQIWLEVVDAGDADPAEVARAVQLRYQTTDFDYETEWPVRMAVICRGRAATHAVAVYLHLAIDANGLRALMADLTHLAPGWERTAPPVTAIEPMDQARRQRTPATMRQGAASLRHLQRVLRAAPAGRFGPPRHDRADAGFWLLKMRSPATALAVRAIAARNDLNTSPVLLAAFAVTLARWNGVNPVFVMLMVSNRFRPGLADTVSGITQSSPCLIDVADRTIDQLAVRASNLAMSAYKYAYYNPYERDAMMAAVNEERGEEVDFSCYFNDRRPPEVDSTPHPLPTDRQIGEAVPLGDLRWEKGASMPHQKLFLGIDQIDHAVVFNLSADDRFFTAADVEAIARGMESVAVEAALDPSAPTGIRSAAV